MYVYWSTSPRCICILHDILEFIRWRIEAILPLQVGFKPLTNWIRYLHSISLGSHFVKLFHLCALAVGNHLSIMKNGSRLSQKVATVPDKTHQNLEHVDFESCKFFLFPSMVVSWGVWNCTYTAENYKKTPKMRVEPSSESPFFRGPPFSGAMLVFGRQGSHPSSADRNRKKHGYFSIFFSGRDFDPCKIFDSFFLASSSSTLLSRLFWVVFLLNGKEMVTVNSIGPQILLQAEKEFVTKIYSWGDVKKKPIEILKIWSQRTFLAFFIFKWFGGRVKPTSCQLSLGKAEMQRERAYHEQVQRVCQSGWVVRVSMGHESLLYDYTPEDQHGK